MCGGGGGAQRREPGVGDRAGREVGEAVGVVGRVDLQVGLADVSVPPVGELQRVDDGRIGAEEHVPAEAVEVDRSNQGPFFGTLRFRLDDRRERHCLVHAETGRNECHLAGEVLPEVRDHLGHDRVHRGAGTELVGVGEEVALERRRLRREVVDRFGVGRRLVPLRNSPESFPGEQARHGKAVEPLPNGDALEDHVASEEFLEHVRGRGRIAELVNTRLDGVAAAEQLHVDQRNVLVADDAFLLQMSKDRRRAEPLVNLDELRFLRETLERRGERPPEEVRAGEEKENGEEEDRADRMQVFRATGARLAARGYGVLRGCASRYDWRMTAAACMSISRSASRRLRPAARSCCDASTVVRVSSQSTTALQVFCRKASAKVRKRSSPAAVMARRAIPTT